MEISFSVIAKNRLFLIIAIITLIAVAGGVGFSYKDNLIGLFSTHKQSNIRYIPFKKNDDDRWGLLDISTGKPIIENEWQNMPSIASESIIKVQNKYGFYEYYKVAEKPVKLGEEYRFAGDFNEGVAVVAKDNEYVTCIDLNGKEVLKIKEIDGKLVESVGSFHEGVASFKNEDGKWGFLDKSGNVIIKARYDEVSDFREGLAKVTETNKNVKSNENTDKDISQSLSSEAPAPSPLPVSLPERTNSEAKENVRKVGFIDKTGKDIIRLSSNVNYRIVSESMIAYSDDDEKSFGFINTKGDKIIKPRKEFKNVLDFNNGLAPFFDGDKWGIINKKGDVIVRAKYDFAYPSNNIVFVSDKHKIGYLDLTGKEIIRPDYESGLPFLAENTYVKDGSKYIVIDKKGRQVGNIDFKFTAGDDAIRKYILKESSYVESDYFDVNTITGMILSKVTKNEINNIKRNMTLGTVMKLYDISDDKLSNYGDSVMGEPIKKFIKYAIVTPEFKFDQNVKEPIKEKKYMYGYGFENIVGYRPNNSAKISAVFLNIQFTKDKAVSKEQEIFKNIKSKFATAGFKLDSNFTDLKSVRYLDDNGQPIAAISNNSNANFVIAMRLN